MRRTSQLWHLKLLIFQACPWEWDSHGNPMENVPWDGMGWDSTNCISHRTHGTVAKHFHSKIF